MRQVMVRYTVKPERVAENEALVRAVYEELARVKPEGLHYATFRLEDGVSFAHVVVMTDGSNPLPELGAFRRFQAGIAERCDAPPVVTQLSEVGSFRFAWSAS